tara:strand:+ start:552 stop:2282 length:1731 start_codon:yes stop_codon:yes gene_type:complete
MKTKFLSSKQNQIFSLFIIFYALHQFYYIFVGGTYWDEINGILTTGRSIEKGILFFTDRNNPKVDTFLLYKEFYGNLVLLPAHFFSRYDFVKSIFVDIFRFENLYNNNNSVEIQFILRHMFLNVYVIGVLILSYFKLSKMETKNFALLTIIFLTLIPSFNGHGLFNLADIPLAMQFFLSSLYFVDYLKNFNENKSSKKTIFTIGFLFGLTVLTRINSYAFIFLIMLFGFYKILRYKINIKSYIYDCFVMGTVSIFVLIIGTPSFWPSPIKWTMGAFYGMFYHPWGGSTLTNGEFIFALETSPWYLLIWFLYKLPIIFHILLIFGIFMIINNKKLSLIFEFSIYFIIVIFIAYSIMRPTTYDGIRHYLFLFPFIAIASSYVVTNFFKNSEYKFIIASIIIVSYLVYTQFGLGPYKYVYFNEFTNEENITIDCEEINGCGNWSTDYWGYSGKELINLTKKYDYDLIYYCEPGHAFTSYLETDSPWEVKNGVPAFDDESVWNQENIIYNKDRLYDLLDKYGQLNFLVTAPHRPQIESDTCGFFNIDKGFDIDCKLIDKVTRNLRNTEINLSFIHSCNIS